MKVLAFVLILLVVLALVYAVVWALSRKWRIEVEELPNGKTQVQLRRAGSRPRVVRELERGADPLDFRVDLDMAMEEAHYEARQLNKHR